MNHFRPDRAFALWWRAVPALLLCAVAAGACSTIRDDYYWAPYPIAAERVTTGADLASGGSVSIINEQSSTGSRLIGSIGRYEYYASLAQLSTAVITQLTDELRKRNITVSGGAKKSLRIRVSSASTERGVWVVRAHIGLGVEAGNGYRLRRPIGNSTPTTIPRAFNGAVALAVIAILNDPKIVEYLTGPI